MFCLQLLIVACCDNMPSFQYSQRWVHAISHVYFGESQYYTRPELCCYYSKALSHCTGASRYSATLDLRLWWRGNVSSAMVRWFYTWSGWEWVAVGKLGPEQRSFSPTPCYSVAGGVLLLFWTTILTLIMDIQDKPDSACTPLYILIIT